jgi:uncharacterized integral membrane protein (TIGR00698 family)
MSAPERSASALTIPSRLPSLLRLEDWWAVWLGASLIAAALVAAALNLPALPKLGLWHSNPLDALPAATLLKTLLLLAGLGAMTAVAVGAMGRGVGSYLGGFIVVAALALAASVLANQTTLNRHGLEYAIWALLFGLLIANTAGTPHWLLAGARSELFIKIGLVLLGVEILAPKIVALGPPGLLVAWGVTPVAVLFMWYLGTRVMRLQSKSLVMVIACCTSVCGVSAAIASAAACRAKKEELTLAVGMTMIFTVIMMVAMPALCRIFGLDELVGGAWIGGTVDSTGAVVASGALLGPTAEKVAAVVKMIQNTLIGVIAFIIAVYWVSVVERRPDGPRPSALEIWVRFPKFVLGFLGASLLFSFIILPAFGPELVDTSTAFTRSIRGWFFALAFAAIGLESNFRQLAIQLVGGKPIVLYLIGQTFNVLLTLLIAWLAFGGVFFTVTV